jgi:hypothetical protein
VLIRCADITAVRQDSAHPRPVTRAGISLIPAPSQHPLDPALPICTMAGMVSSVSSRPGVEAEQVWCLAGVVSCLAGAGCQIHLAVEAMPPTRPAQLFVSGRIARSYHNTTTRARLKSLGCTSRNRTPRASGAGAARGVSMALASLVVGVGIWNGEEQGSSWVGRAA